MQNPSVNHMIRISAIFLCIFSNGIRSCLEAADLGGDYRILCVSERFLSLILLGGEILRAAAEITCSQSWDYRLRSQKEQLLGRTECLANCSVCIGLL